jgi:hypothetical protein
MNMNDQIPDIYFDGNYRNPCIASPNSEYAIFFAQTRETLNGDTELCKRFVENAVSNFRHSRVYKHYKSYLYDLGMDRCQILGNINTDMATIEMHHNGLTIFDVALIITWHLVTVQGSVTEFDVIHHLRRVHTMNMVPLVMLCKTMHQLEHNNDEFYIPVQMTFGDWEEFLKEYHFGVTYGISKKLEFWINKSLREQVDKGSLNESTIMLRKQIKEWSEYNECGYNNSDRNPYNPFARSFSNYLATNIQYPTA